MIKLMDSRSFDDDLYRRIIWRMKTDHCQIIVGEIKGHDAKIHRLSYDHGGKENGWQSYNTLLVIRSYDLHRQKI